MIDIKIPIVNDVNDTYTWLYKTVEWTKANYPSFQYYKDSVEPHIVRDPKDLHYRFEFGDEKEATLFLLRWS